MFLSNEGASKVLALLGVKVNNDTIRRLYDRIKLIDNPDVEEIGIDDVAIRKEQTYATAVYDLKDHHLIALLEGQDAETLMERLKSHQKIRREKDLTKNIFLYPGAGLLNGFLDSDGFETIFYKKD